MPTIGTSKVFQIKDFQIYGSDTFLNVYGYIATGVGAYPAEDVARQFETDVITPGILLLQHSGITRESIYCEQVNVIDNFFEGPSLVGAGTLTGQATPNFVAASFQLNRATKETRNGRKRISGQTEDVIGTNFWTAAFQTVMDGVATILGATITVVGSGDLEPCIISKRYDSEGTLLPPSQWVYNLVNGVTAIPAVKHQNTRLLGRGI